MIALINDYKEMGRGFNTSLPESFVGVLNQSLKREGITLTGISDEGKARRIFTDAGEVVMKGSFCVNDVINKIWKQ